MYFGTGASGALRFITSNLGTARGDHQHEDGGCDEPCGKRDGLAVENRGDQQGDEGLQELNLADIWFSEEIGDLDSWKILVKSRKQISL